MGPPNSLLLPPVCATITSAPNLTWCAPQIADSVSLTSYWRFMQQADCEVPVVKVPPVEMGTEYCVP